MTVLSTCVFIIATNQKFPSHTRLSGLGSGLGPESVLLTEHTHIYFQPSPFPGLPGGGSSLCFFTCTTLSDPSVRCMGRSGRLILGDSVTGGVLHLKGWCYRIGVCDWLGSWMSFVFLFH